MITGWRDFDDTVRALSMLQRRIDHVFDDWSPPVVFERPLRAGRASWPAVNVFETKDEFVYRAEVPGLAEGDVGVYVEDDALVLRGERKSEIPAGYQVRLREREPVAFTRKLPLPGRVDAQAVAATLKDGLLTVTLPKTRDALPRQIAVKAG